MNWIGANVIKYILFAQMVELCQLLNLRFFSRTSYDKIIKNILDLWFTMFGLITNKII